ncbi:ShlB/FhaC/HecB family hemolysin secretion/activation protein [Endozoicomonas arenosclerae]|uniref:ShlB/FhaC/HecB family hemolysin secretion/activation protein n=1 Tax=Endozoicomonas arenosclerae TaxID=1633495 RepID=UPI0007847B9B|nr:ShlB/FhaC/HecB family hemolysin secretion/activation protein [Endozoicomonas arenosclerae]
MNGNFRQYRNGDNKRGRILRPFVLAPLFAHMLAVSAHVHAVDVPATPSLIPEAPDINPRDIEKEFEERKSDLPDDSEGAFAEEDEFGNEPHITVNGFAFRNLPEYPEAGITRQAIEKLAEDLRQDFMRVEDTLDSGFLQQDLEQLGQFLKQKLEQGSDDLTLDDLNELNALLRKQRSQRGLTYSDIIAITEEITRFYRERGLFLAKVFVPPQDVQQGVVQLDIVAGTLGKVVVEGNKKYDSEQLVKPFEEQVGDLVNNQKVEESIYLLNDLPGLNVYGFFEKGDNLGESNLNLQVRDEKEWQLTVRADNHGPEFTGEHRLFVQGDWMNPTGIGDQLSLGALKSFNPDNADLYQLRYSLPVYDSRTRLEFFTEKNDYAVTSDSEETVNRFGITGTNTTYTLTLMHQLKRSRAENFALGLRLSDKNSDRDSALPVAVGLNEGDKAKAVEFIFEGDHLSTRFKTLNMGRLGLQYGRFKNEVDNARGDDYYKVALDSNSLFFIPLPMTDSESRLILKTKLRYGNTGLPAFEQFSLGGSSGVRAYSPSEFSADTGAYIGAEMYFDVPERFDFDVYGGHRLSDVLQYAIIAEAAYGIENAYKSNEVDEKPVDPWAHLAGIGLLMRLNWMDQFASTLTFSKPVSDKSSTGTVGNDADWQLLADFTYYLN